MWIKEDDKIMRKHVGQHILADGLENACGFCGLVGCIIDLITGSGRGKTATLTAGSNCPYKTKFSLKAAKKSPPRLGLVPIAQSVVIQGSK